MNDKFRKLTDYLAEAAATTRPVPEDVIVAAEKQLGLDFGSEYCAYLSRFGVIVSGSVEVYGLGVPHDYYLNILAAYADLSQDSSYPLGALPLTDEGDGRYYLFDTVTLDVLLWATPNGGIVRRVSQGLEDFLLARVQSQ